MAWNSGRRYPTLNSAETRQRFKGYVVLVAGGCSGIGRATVERFANDGATVYAIDKQVQGQDEFQEKFPEKIKCVELDVTDEEKCRTVVADIAGENNSSINTVINSVAYFGSKGITADKSDWMKSFEVNVFGYANMVTAAVPYMKGENCSVVNVCSISGHRAQPDRWTYSATKGAISILTKCMALDLGPKNIRVNAVSPSWIWTRQVSKAAGDNREKGEQMWSRFFVADRMGEVEEVAAVMTFLASKDASYMTGSDIPVCGGYLAIGPEQKGEFSTFAPPDE